MSKVKRKYNETADLPDCEDCGNMKIDVDNLQDYSMKILKGVLNELDRVISEIPKMLNYSFTAADEFALKDFYERSDADTKYYTGIREKIKAEIENRGNDQ